MNYYDVYNIRRKKITNLFKNVRYLGLYEMNKRNSRLGTKRIIVKRKIQLNYFSLRYLSNISLFLPFYKKDETRNGRNPGISLIDHDIADVFYLRFLAITRFQASQISSKSSSTKNHRGSIFALVSFTQTFDPRSDHPPKCFNSSNSVHV